MGLLFLLCGLTAVVLLALIAAYLFLSGLPAIRELGLGPFLLGRTWDPDTLQFGLEAKLRFFWWHDWNVKDDKE